MLNRLNKETHRSCKRPKLSFLVRVLFPESGDQQKLHKFDPWRFCCVKPVGNLASYSDYITATGGPTITVPPATFSFVNTAIPVSSSNPGYSATTLLLPTASGTIQGCNTYRNYDPKNSLNSCSHIAYAYGVTTA